MKHLKWILGLVLLAVVPVLAVTNVAHAQRFASSVDKEEKVHSSLYSSGRNISIKGEIFGDVFCAGQNITIDATVHGDIICAGQDLTINGKVDGDIRVAGQAVNVAADIANNATVAAQTFSLDAGAKVGRDLMATGSNLNIKGEVARDLTANGPTVRLNGQVGRNASVKSDRIELKQDARIAGNLTYDSSRKPDLAGGAKVEGATKKTEDKKSGRAWFNPVLYLFAIAGVLLMMALLALLFPKYLQRTSGHIMQRPGRTLLIGFAATFLLPLVVVGFAVTLVGIPFAILLVVAALFAMLLSTPVSAYLTGRLILRNSKSTMNIALLGAAVLVTLYFVPFAGYFFLMGAYWLGFGALLYELYTRSRFGQPAKPAKKAEK